MSSLRKASKAAAGGRAHKERSQPGFRARFGLLEKHKDYVLRAKDFQKKQEKLQKLKEKAANRNPDEFFFKMINSQNVKGVHRGESNSKVYTEEEMKLIRSQDAGFLVSKAQSEMKKVERLRSSVLPVSANTNKHVYFVEDGDEVENARERVVNRPAEPLQMPRVRKKLTKEMQERTERAAKLKEMASAVDLQKQLSGKGRKRKLRSGGSTAQERTIAWKVANGAPKALTRLRDAGVKLAVVSNFDSRLRPILQDLQVDTLFDALIISAEVGYEKPSREIFEAALSVLGLDARVAVHVGDDPTNDKQGAVAAGLESWLWKVDVKSFDELADHVLQPAPRTVR